MSEDLRRPGLREKNKKISHWKRREIQPRRNFIKLSAMSIGSFAVVLNAEATLRKTLLNRKKNILIY